MEDSLYSRSHASKPFVLCRAEAELLGYTEAMTVGDSLTALTNVLEGQWLANGLGGDNLVGCASWKLP